MQVSTFVRGSVAAVAFAAMASASAAEYPIGKQHIENGMEGGMIETYERLDELIAALS